MSYEKANIQITIKLDGEGLIPDSFKKGYDLLIESVKVLKDGFVSTRLDMEEISKENIVDETSIIAKRHTCNHDVSPSTPCVEEEI